MEKIVKIQKMKTMTTSTLALLFTLFALFVTLMCATTEARRLIVHLQEDPLIETKAFKAIHKEVMMKRSLRNSLERNTPLGEFIANNKELRAQEKRVRSQQERLIAALPEGWKVAEIARENGKRQKAVTHIVSNAVVIDIGNSDVRKAKSTLILMPGVKSVEEEHEIMLNTFQSLGQIGATSVYETLGLSELDIGRGIKIAVTDNGNYVDTEMMNDEGFALPADVPADRGEISNVNNKLIVSRAYGTYNHSYQEPDKSNHGIHTSSTAGGRRVNVTLYGHSYTLSGVAPGAWLMNYRFVGTSGADTLVLYDNIVEDNPDISSNSWGPTYPIFNSNVIDYKLFVNRYTPKMSAGNDGPQALTMGASLEKAIVVGACTKEDVAFYSLKVVGTDMRYTCIASKQTTGIKEEEYNIFVAGDSHNTAENSAILIYNNNDDYFSLAEDAKKEGANLMIVREYSSLNHQTTTLPSIHCYENIVNNLTEYVSQNESASITIELIREIDVTQDIIADFSSRGPTQDMRLQPDVVAPGVNVLAAGYGYDEDPRKGFNFLDGTSMSTPIVSGAAAVILQHHTEFTMEEVKSALMTTAEFKGVIRWEDGKPAQPLDMGAGRINLERAIDPDLYISPPKVDFSLAQKPHRYTKTLTVHSYRDKDVTVEVSIVLHSGWNEATPAGNHLKAEPSEFTLSSSKRDMNVTISLDTGSIELGDQNAYVVFTNKMNGKELGHAPLWGQITYPEEEKKDILLIIIDKDKCDGTKSEGIVDVYKKTLDEFSLSYDVFEYCQNDGAFSLPEKAKGLGYRAVIIGMANVYKGELTLVEPEIRRMMHAKVPVIQMWVNIPYAWDMCKRALNSEFGFKDVNELTDLVPASSKYFVEGTLIPRNVNFKYPPITTLLEEGNEKKIIVSAKDDSATEEYKTINSIGITSFVGLEAFKEEYRKYALSLMLGNALETRKDIVVTNSLNITQKGSQNIIEETFSVASRSMFSNVSYVKFNCGYGEQESIAMGQDNLAQFTCSPKESGTYKIVLIVFTTSENRFLFTYNRTVGISSASGLAPTFLLAAFAAFLFLLGK